MLILRRGQVTIEACLLKKKNLSLAGGVIHGCSMSAVTNIGHTRLKAWNFYEMYKH